MNDPIYIGNGILEQIKNFDYVYPVTITKESVFKFWMDSFKEFYEEYPYAVKWDYEKFLREILDYPYKDDELNVFKVEEPFKNHEN